MATRRYPWLRPALAVLGKDMRAEFRSRYAYSALLMFAVTTLLTVGFAVGGVGLEVDLAAALLWVIIFFSAMAGLSRTFVQEEESGTALALRVAADPVPVFLGKYLFNLVLLVSMAVVLVPLYLVLLNVVVARVDALLAVLLVGLPGLAGTSTLLAALVAKASAKGTLMTVLAFPVLLPLLLGATGATRGALGGGSIAWELWLMFFHQGMTMTTSLYLFRYVWDE